MSNQYSFSNVPIIRHKRSRFDLSHGVKTSGNVGTLYPFEVQEVYPGDTFKISTNVVSRLSSSFLKPIMDNLFLDVYYFFVPSRTVYDKFVNVFGENTESAWANNVEYKVPTLTNAIANTVTSKTVGDYLGLPINYNMAGVSVLPFRAFAKIYNEWFRDQNNIAPMHIQTGETTSSELLNNNDWAPNNYTGKLPKVAKFHDLFSSCLPAPQKGNAIDIPLSGFGDVPVYTKPDSVPTGIATGAGLRIRGQTQAGNEPTGNFRPLAAQFVNNSVANTFILPDVSLTPATNSKAVFLDNVWARTQDLASTGFSVNDLRFAFQYQKMLERDARSGSRFVEYIAGHFNVSAGDYRLQRSEFLGGKRVPISITQVTQTTGANNENSPLGELAGYSHTASRSRFTKSFVEHGYVIGVFCIRQHHTYQQGIEKMWLRSKRSDFYDPVFANIGEQPLMKRELFAGVLASSDEPFGYQEAWYDLRTRCNRVSGQMRSQAEDSLDYWHLADLFSKAPTLNENFINETPVNVDRCITVQSANQDQFILDFWINNIAYRVLPTYSVPSLVDHN